MRMSLSPPPGTGKRKTVPEQTDFGPSHLAYATSLLSTLNSERELARTAHARAQAEAQATIARLQAQVARRDAEIERLAASSPTARGCPYCAGAKEVRSPRGGSPASAWLDEPVPVRITKDDAIQILEKSASRNRGLKREVEGLVARVSRGVALVQRDVSYHAPSWRTCGLQPARLRFRIG